MMRLSLVADKCLPPAGITQGAHCGQWVSLCHIPRQRGAHKSHPCLTQIHCQLVCQPTDINYSQIIGQFGLIVGSRWQKWLASGHCRMLIGQAAWPWNNKPLLARVLHHCPARMGATLSSHLTMAGWTLLTQDRVASEDPVPQIWCSWRLRLWEERGHGMCWFYRNTFSQTMTNLLNLLNPYNMKCGQAKNNNCTESSLRT